MSLGNCRLKEISDKYWSVAESIFGFKEDVESYKFILDKPNETKISDESLLKSENMALNHQLMDALNDKPRDGLIILSSEIMIEVNNKILAEDYEAALEITMKGIDNYGGFRELLDLKRILERKCLINRGQCDGNKDTHLLTVTRSLKTKNCNNKNSSSESDYSSESSARSVSSSCYTISDHITSSSADLSSNDNDETLSYYSSSSYNDSPSLTETVSHTENNSKLTVSSPEHNASVHRDNLLSFKPISLKVTENRNDMEEAENTDDYENISSQIIKEDDVIDSDTIEGNDVESDNGDENDIEDESDQDEDDDENDEVDKESSAKTDDEDDDDTDDGDDDIEDQDEINSSTSDSSESDLDDK